MKNLLFAGLLIMACSACSKEDDKLMTAPSEQAWSDTSNDAPSDENVIFEEETL